MANKRIFFKNLIKEKWLGYDTKTWFRSYTSTAKRQNIALKILFFSVPIEVAPKKASTVSTSSSNGPPNDRIYQNTLPFQKPDSGVQDPTNLAKPTVSGPYIHISECFSGKPVPPKPPPRQITSSLGSNQQHEKPINRVPSTGSHRHDSSTDEEQVRINFFK